MIHKLHTIAALLSMLAFISVSSTVAVISLLSLTSTPTVLSLFQSFLHQVRMLSFRDFQIDPRIFRLSVIIMFLILGFEYDTNENKVSTGAACLFSWNTNDASLLVGSANCCVVFQKYIGVIVLWSLVKMNQLYLWMS